MDLIVLYSMQDYYLIVYFSKSEKKYIDSDKNFIKKSSLKSLEDVFEGVVGKEKRSWFLFSVKVGENIVVFKLTFWNFLIYPYFKLRALRIGQVVVAEYRLRSRVRLIDDLSSNDVSLKLFVEAYSKYTYHDEYSLWIFNEDTKNFTFVVGSSRPNKDYVSYDEKTTLNDVVDTDFESQSRSPKESDIVDYKEKGMKSVTRLALCLGHHKQRGILSFYSTLRNFRIQEKVIGDIRSLVEMKYLESLMGAQQGLEKVTQALIVSGLSSMEKYLQVLTEKICDELEYEAASAFVVNENTGDMDLVSTHNLHDKGWPSIPVSYPKNSESLTIWVKDNPDYIHVVYDLQNSEFNSHIFDEPTENPPINWIGVPVEIDGEVVVVFRMKNKFRVDSNGNEVIISPRPTDYFNIRALLTIVESQVYNSLKYKELSRKLDVHDNFARVYRHEIRGPVSSLVTTPHRLAKKISKNPLGENEKQAIVKELYDLESLAENLAFIARSYNIEALISGGQKGEKLSLLSDFVIPIEKITKRYYKTKYDSNLVVDHDSMRGASVYGEKELYNMVIYALLDNAGKYQYFEEGDIKLFARYKETDQFLFLFVENIGLEIKEHEVESIFNNYGRGEIASSCNIDGSGIGLWLCRKVVEKFGGKIEVESRFNPVRFKLTLPMECL